MFSDDHLQLLADVALRTEPDHSAVSEPEPAPTQRMLTRSTHTRKGQPSSKSNKVAKRLVRSRATAEDDKARQERRIKAIIEQAHKIKSVGNSPVKPAQLRLLRSVFYSITKFPPDFWIALLAVITKRRFAQVKVWFSNERQHVRSDQVKRNLPQDPVISVTTQHGYVLRLRKEAVQLCEGQLDWSDDLFEGAVRLHYIRQ